LRDRARDPRDGDVAARALPSPFPQVAFTDRRRRTAPCPPRIRKLPAQHRDVCPLLVSLTLFSPFFRSFPQDAVRAVGFSRSLLHAKLERLVGRIVARTGHKWSIWSATRHVWHLS
jgi:hypothetical protein